MGMEGAVALAIRNQSVLRAVSSPACTAKVKLYYANCITIILAFKKSSLIVVENLLKLIDERKSSSMMPACKL